MTTSDITCESSDFETLLKSKESKVEENEQIIPDSIPQKNDTDNNYEHKEKRERNSSLESYAPGYATYCLWKGGEKEEKGTHIENVMRSGHIWREKKKICCCRESMSKCSSRNEKSSSASKSSKGDTLSTASTGITEFANMSQDPNEPFKFFIGGIPQHISNRYITEYFEKYGPVDNVVIAQDHETKRNRGFAFVTMSSQINRDRILSDLHELNGKRVDVREEHNTTPSDIQRKIFVGGLNYYWTKDTLERHNFIKKKKKKKEHANENYFSSFGEIDVVQIVVDSSGRSRCFGFVVFTHESSVAKVLRHKRHKIYDKMVEVRKAEPKKPKMAMKRKNKKSSSKYALPPPFIPPFPCNKETMAQWANFMYSACGMPFLFNQRFQNVPDFYPNYNCYPNSLENMNHPDYNK
ncbi:RNA-binding protein, putative [Plasmodium ovale wallikeri]|uniref:RNA-binding protein, putative n=1 Tax=Plasmodium ovale wallikeri TaxID=864142 RepID=A0A1A8YL70_PLAOA|nr:RNA-binding protein, putative [Plasmodium ovale wallikeri]SBT32913.1 RNA-binding protein, putative [Plasmodium ovale wallikeri]